MDVFFRPKSVRSRANAVLFPFCDSVRRGQPSFALESYIGRETAPRGTLLVRVKDADVIEVRAYLPTLI